MKEKAAQIVEKVSKYYAENSVGKSFPLWTYEVDVPQELSKDTEEEK